MSLAPTQREIEMVMRLSLERCKLYYPEITYYTISIAPPDLVYNDVENKTISKKVKIHPYVEEAPSVELLERWGFSKSHEIYLVVLNYELSELEISPREGDVFVYRGSEYTVKSLKTDTTSLFGPSNVPFNLIIGGNIRTPRIDTDDRIDKTISRRSDQKTDVLGD